MPPLAQASPTHPEHLLTDREWEATLQRVRSEFAEMPCLRVTTGQACVLFGLTKPATDRILNQLTAEGFLMRTPDGQYARRDTAP